MPDVVPRKPINGASAFRTLMWDGIHERRALPDCQYCSSANTLERIDSRICVCSCCGKETKLVDGRAVQAK